MQLESREDTSNALGVKKTKTHIFISNKSQEIKSLQQDSLELKITPRH